MDLKIKVRNKIAAADSENLIICGNSDYTLTFDFDDEWAGEIVRTAVFVYTRAGVKYRQEVPFAGDTVEVPVLSDISTVEVGVYSGDLRTTTGAKLRCEKSILCGAGTHEEPAEDVYNQLVALLNIVTGQRALTAIAITEAADGSVTIVDTLEGGVTETIVIGADESGNPSSLTYNGVEIPLSWTEASA